MADLFDLSGKVALVTGGSRGLARHRAWPCRSGRRSHHRQPHARHMRTRRPRSRNPWPQSVGPRRPYGRWAEIEAVVDRAYAHFGRIDILVNNAGMSPAAASSLDTSEKLMDAVLALNFQGPMRLSALVGTRMAAEGGGCIINISSAGSVRPTPEIIPYAGAKAALNAMTIAHAQEFAPHVRINAVLPGSFRTDVAQHWPADKEAHTPAAIKRFGEPEEIVSTILYLASDHSRFTTGMLIRVDGGRP